MTLFAVLYDGLNAGWLSPEDLSQTSPASRCVSAGGALHPTDDGSRHGVAVHEFSMTSTSCI